MAKQVEQQLHQLERITDVPASEQVYIDMQRYALYTTRHRVTADARDGLIPVQRRLLYTMFEDLHMKSKTSRVKSQSVVGMTLKYHPHGDSSVYGAVKPLTNWFESKVPLIANTGNFGSLYGDVAAAARYTEIGLSEFALEVVFGDLAETKQATDWLRNYDDTTVEPEYLPVKVPLLLINGSFGIGVGMKPEIPSHNLGEVIDVTLKLIDNPDADFILVPDHCMPCEIINTDWKKINNGQISNYTIRSKIDIIDLPNGQRELLLSSIPNLTFLEKIDKDGIDVMMANNELPQVAKVEDRSDDDHCEYHIILKKGADAEYVRQIIWKKTVAMKTDRVNLEVLIDGTPQVLTYREYLLAFINQRKLTKTRLYANKLVDYDTMYHEREAFVKVLSSGEIDKVIDLIKKKGTTDDKSLIEFLMNRYHITDIQASYIINAKLKYLSMQYLDRYKKDMDELIENINSLNNKLNHESIIIQEIKDELIAIKKKYNQPRQCTIINESVDNIPAGMFNIIVTTNNFIRKIPASETVKNNRSDNIKTVIQADNRESILIFDNMGKVFKLPIHKIPMTDRTGTDIRFLIKGLTADICSIIYEPDLIHYNDKTTKYFLTVITAQGNIKKMDLADFTTVPLSGILYSKLDPGDKVLNILIINDHFDILVCAGKSAIRVPMKEVSHLKRNTKGSKAMTTNHPISCISLIKPNSEFILVVTAGGMANKINAVALPVKSRGKSGNSVIKLAKNDYIIAAMGVNDTDKVNIMAQSGAMIFNVADIKPGSTVGEGVRLVNKSDAILGCWM